MNHDPEFLGEDEAARLWQRAAQLQAEAARRAEVLAEEPKSEEGEVAAPQGYALDHVRSAALEVGIAREFVDAALADLRAERALPERKRASRLARRLIRSPDTLTASRVIEAAAPKVLSAMEAVFPRAHYRLTLTDQQGDPLSGGVLVFDIQGLGSPFPQEFALEAKFGGIEQVFVSVRPIEGATPSCEVTLRSPVTSHIIDLLQAGIATGLAGGAGFGLGLALVAAASAPTGLGPLATILAAVVVLGGTLVGGGLGLKGYRALYRYSMRRGRKALAGLLGAVAGRAQGGWGIPLPDDGEPPRSLPDAPDLTD